VNPFGTPLPVCFYEFDQFRIDVRRRLLLRGDEPVAIKPKALDTLLVLVEHRDRVVEKEELMTRLWPDTAVEEANLTQNVFVIRKALGEVPGEQKFIATAARRGYRFVADVREVLGSGPETAEVEGRKRRTLVFVALAAVALAISLTATLARNSEDPAAAARISSIAVLPFRNLSPESDREYFADGITEAVISDLTAISSLRVLSVQSSMKYKASQKLLPEIARELGVDAIVEGSVVSHAGRVRLTVQLVHARTDRNLWTASYDRDAGDILALQGELARSVAGAVHVAVTAEEHATLAGRRTVDPEAYDLYLRGRHLFELRSEEALQKSIAYYQQAIARDPTFAPAHAGIALTYAPMGYLAYRPGAEVGPRVKAAAEKALAIDPTLIDGHVALAAFTVLFEWDWIGGERTWKQILQRSPNHPTARLWYGFLLERVGRLDEALAERKRAVQADPLSPAINVSLANTLQSMGRHDEAIDVYRRTLDLDGTFAAAHVGIGVSYLAKGMPGEALAELEAAGGPKANGKLVSAPLGHVYGRIGRSTDARRVLHALEQQGRERYVSPLALAYVHAGLGERDAAFAKLEQAYDQRSPNLVGIKVDRLLEPLRDDPRFAQLVRRMNLPWP
jgi:TolB-like protein/DNA-binding winged helix-turn-helix (wHTH) protein/Tfp pilus assembly protein PilF